MSNAKLQEYISTHFIDSKWDKVVIENSCGDQDVPIEEEEMEFFKENSRSSTRSSRSSTRSSRSSTRNSRSSRSSRSSSLDSDISSMTTESSQDGGGIVIKYTPTQKFISEYFTPSIFAKGMLLWHSVGTGKTCSAIATATKNFESQGYTILWVTRSTLKSDIWKNMFDQICNEQIRIKVDNGLKIPTEQSKRMSLLSKAWSIRPLSYKQFTNLVSKNNQFYHDLVKKNGAEDPLRKTLLIIDEAHKLYGGGDLSGQERPNMEELKSAIMKSYIHSGDESVRLLLMTATPITEGPMELIKLLNLCKLPEEQMPETFDEFSQEYLDEEGVFTERGKTKYMNDISGILSYLNREFDVRQFAQPNVKFVLSNMINNRLVDQFDVSNIKENKELTTKIKAQISELTREHKTKIKQITYKEKDFKYLYDNCEKLKSYKTKKINPYKICQTDIKQMIKNILLDIKQFIETMTNEYDEMIEELKSNIKGDMKLDKKSDSYAKYTMTIYYNLLSKCRENITKSHVLLSIQPFMETIEELKKEIKALMIEIKELKGDKDAIKEIKQQIETKKKVIKENEEEIKREKKAYRLQQQQDKREEKGRKKREQKIKKELSKFKKINIEDNAIIKDMLDELKEQIEIRIDELIEMYKN